jgi:hypothetical protein
VTISDLVHRKSCHGDRNLFKLRINVLPFADLVTLGQAITDVIRSVSPGPRPTRYMTQDDGECATCMSTASYGDCAGKLPMLAHLIASVVRICATVNDV